MDKNNRKDALEEALKLGNSRVFNLIVLGIAAQHMDFSKEQWYNSNDEFMFINILLMTVVFNRSETRPRRADVLNIQRVPSAYSTPGNEIKIWKK